MTAFVLFLLILNSPICFALNNSKNVNRAIQVGTKHYIAPQPAYHFSSKELISAHLSTKKPFFIGQNIGDLRFKEHNKNKRILILNEGQLQFFNKLNFIVESSPFLNWEITKLNLTVSGVAKPYEYDLLLKACSSMNFKSIKLDLHPPPQVRRFTLSKEQILCLGQTPMFKLEIAVLNQNRLKEKKAGLGIPSELLWTAGGSKVSLNPLSASARANSNRTRADGHSFFSAKLEVKEPLVFESGSEVLIRPNGVFNRQKNEWKKALTNIEVQILKFDHESVKTEFKINKTERTGESGVFNVEKFSQVQSLSLKKWKKLLTFDQSGKNKSKNKLFGMSLLGLKQKSQNTSKKEIWMRVSLHD